jgi:hypothetical protein
MLWEKGTNKWVIDAYIEVMEAKDNWVLCFSNNPFVLNQNLFEKRKGGLISGNTLFMNNEIGVRSWILR